MKEFFMKKVFFISPNGELISFQICDYIGEWNEIGGIYMFCRFNKFRSFNGLYEFEPLYIGKSNNFKNRLSNHEKWDESTRLGAVKVLAFIESSESKRNQLEFHLIQHFDPPVNKQLRPPYNQKARLGLADYLYHRQPTNSQIGLGVATPLNQHQPTNLQARLGLATLPLQSRNLR
jgi:hypothetical protein